LSNARTEDERFFPAQTLPIGATLTAAEPRLPFRNAILQIAATIRMRRARSVIGVTIAAVFRR
jgi:hypothetical protein